MKGEAELIDAKMVQKLIAILAFSLPVILVLGQSLSGAEPRFYPTISEYVYGSFKNVFIGTLYAMGMLFFTYKGYKVNQSNIFKIPDSWLANITGFFLILVATCNTLPCLRDGSPWEETVSFVHKVSAIMVFASMGIFCLCYFTQEKLKDTQAITMRRVHLYKLCGYTIFICMLLIGLLFTFDKTCPTSISSAYILWLEWIMIWAFAFAWSVKGRLILKSDD